MAKGNKTTATKTTTAADATAAKGIRTKKNRPLHSVLPKARIMTVARSHGNRPWAESGKAALHLASNLVVQAVVDETISRRDERKRIKVKESDLSTGVRVAFERLRGNTEAALFLNSLPK